MMVMGRSESTFLAKKTKLRICKTVWELTGVRLNNGSAHSITHVLLPIWQIDESEKNEKKLI